MKTDEKYYVAYDGLSMFYREDGNGHWFRHTGDGKEERVLPSNPGTHRVIMGARDEISKSNYDKGVDPKPIH